MQMQAVLGGSVVATAASRDELIKGLDEIFSPGSYFLSSYSYEEGRFLLTLEEEACHSVAIPDEVPSQEDEHSSSLAGIPFDYELDVGRLDDICARLNALHPPK